MTSYGGREVERKPAHARILIGGAVSAAVLITLVACTPAAEQSTGSPSPTAAATATATGTATPAPSFPGLVLPNATGPVPRGFFRYGGRVTDVTSGLPVVGACVYVGPPAGCPLGATPRTDTNGNFWIDLPSSGWEFTVEHPAYKTVLSRTISPGATDPFIMTRKP